MDIDGAVGLAHLFGWMATAVVFYGLGRIDGELLGCAKGEAAAAKRQREAIEHELRAAPSAGRRQP